MRRGSGEQVGLAQLWRVTAAPGTSSDQLLGLHPLQLLSAQPCFVHSPPTGAVPRDSATTLRHTDLSLHLNLRHIVYVIHNMHTYIIILIHPKYVL